MNKDKNFQRRMIVSKYSNRPPFDLKKPQESYDISDKIKAYPEESCKNCCRNRTIIEKPKDIARCSKSLASETVEKHTRIPSKVIPKIIETFQRLTPAEEQPSDDSTMSKNASIHTLYRKPKTTCKLGKNIPKHKLMKSLLQNLDNEEERCKNVGTNKRRLSKNKRNKKQFFDKDEEIRPDFNVSFVLNNAQVPENMSNVYYNPYQMLDKKTSTTGLQWPPKSKHMLQYSSVKNTSASHLNKRSSHSYQYEKNPSSSFGVIKEEKNATVSKGDYDSLKEVPTKDEPQNRKYYQEPCRSEKTCGYRKNEVVNDHFRQKHNEAPTAKQNSKTSHTSFKPEIRSDCHIRHSTSKVKPREKTFVQTQVDKLNKVLKITRIPAPPVLPQQNSGTFRKEQVPENYQKRQINSKTTGANYIALMDHVKNNCPHYGTHQDFESDPDWSSDSFEPEIVPEHIRFPKETRTAVDQRLNEKKQRVPLSKFTKVYENCRPAISPNNIDSPRYDEYEHYEDYYDKYQHGDGRGQFPYYGKEKPLKNKDVRKSGPVKGRTLLTVPCKKNLLCDKGHQHLGPCGYTRNKNKIIY